jgi:hypothetical protein
MPGDDWVMYEVLFQEVKGYSPVVDQDHQRSTPDAISRDDWSGRDLAGRRGKMGAVAG